MFLQHFKNLFFFYLKLLGLYLLFFIVVALIQKLFPDIDLKQYSQDVILEMLKHDKIKIFILAVIVAPITEELMFRTLVKPKRYDLFIFLSIWTTIAITLFNPFTLSWHYNAILTIVLFTVLFFTFQKLIPIKSIKKIVAFLNHHYRIVLQITSVIFGLFHVFNYVDSFLINSALFILITPRIIAGHLFGQIKIENNHIIWSIVLHAMNNGVLFLVLLNKPL